MSKETEALDFVKSIDLPSDDDLGELLDRLKNARDATHATPLAVRDNEASAQVVGGSLSSFTERLSGESKSDVKNSTLLAQLAADYVFDKFTQPIDWYQKYGSVLGTIGWNIPAFSFDKYTASGTTVKMDEAVLGILAAIATGDELAIVRATMDGLKGLSDDSKQMLIWDSKSNSGNNGTFQIFPVDKLPNDDVVMLIDAMQFTAQTSHYRFLWWSWESSSIAITRSAQRFVLNEDVYAKVRQAVIDKLGDRATQLVADIPI